MSIVGLVRGLNAEINLAEVFQKNLRLDGIETGSRSMLEDLLTWLDTKRVHPIIDKVFAFEEGEAAFRHLKAGGHFGKAGLTLN